MTFALRSLGWDGHFSAAYAAAVPALLARPTGWVGARCRPGRVLRAGCGVCTVLTAAGTVRASLAGAVLAAAGADPTARPGAGDWVVVREWPDGPITAEVVLPRRSTLWWRTAGDASERLLAANADTVAVVEPIDRAPDLRRVERLLSLAWRSGARPLVLLSRSDRAADPTIIRDRVAAVAPGVAVLPVDATGGRGLAQLRRYVRPGRTLALLGSAGGDASAIITALVGAPAVRHQRGSRAGGTGHHPVASAVLVPLAGGGAVLDTSAVRTG